MFNNYYDTNIHDKPLSIKKKKKKKRRKKHLKYIEILIFFF